MTELLLSDLGKSVMTAGDGLSGGHGASRTGRLLVKKRPASGLRGER